MFNYLFVSRTLRVRAQLSCYTNVDVKFETLEQKNFNKPHSSLREIKLRGWHEKKTSNIFFYHSVSTGKVDLMFCEY